MAPLAQLDRVALSGLILRIARTLRPLLFGAWMLLLAACVFLYAAGAFFTLLCLGQLAQARSQFRRDLAHGRAAMDRLGPKDGASFSRKGD